MEKITLIEVVVVVGAFGLGVASTAIHNKIKQWKEYVNLRFEELEEKIPTPDEIAKSILTMKMPIKDLPPELLAEIRKEAEFKKPPNKLEMSYLG